MTSRRRSRRVESLVNPPMVRRSPRLSSRPPVDPSSHQLHRYQVSSRPSLSGYERTRHSISRSHSPATILNESGQSVPPSFEDAEQVISHTAENQDGMPRHLYGLDGDIEVEEEEVEITESGSEPNRVWSVYDKERVVLTTSTINEQDTPPDSPYDNQSGFCSGIIHFFTSLLFKLGSLLYLASAAILCLDVIVLHRLFNFAPISQRVGTISRFFILLLALCAIVGFLLGGHLYPVSSEEPEPVLPPSLSNDEVQALKSNILKFVSAKLDGDLKNFEAKYRDEMDLRINTMIEGSNSKVTFTLREEIAAEGQRRKEAMDKLWDQLTSEINRTVQYHILEMRNSLDSRFSEQSEQLEAAKKLLSSEMDGLRDGQNSLSQTVRKMLDEVKEKQHAYIHNVSALILNFENHDSRLDSLERKQKEVLGDLANLKNSYLARIRALEMNDTIPEHLVVDIFYQELEKATANKDSPLRLWLNLIFASKNDLQGIHHQIDELRTHKLGDRNYLDLTRQDIEDMIAFSLRRFGADRIGKFDFALESSGGSVMLKHCSPTYTHTITSVSLFGLLPLWHVASTPKTIIQPSLYPGNCWAMEGQNGHATVKLREGVVITGVTIDHIPQELSPNGTLDTAPKDFSVQGFTSLEEAPVSLGKFTYNLNGAPIQEFKVDDSRSVTYNFVRFDFLSNYGNFNFTCIYRVRVHGRYP